MPELRAIPIQQIEEPETPVREAMDEGKLNELAASLRAIGLIQPICVKDKGDTFEIEAGHRRFLAARSLGWREIRCIVYAQGELIEGAAMLAENIYREDLTAAEEAIFFAQLLDKYNLDEAGLCERVKQSADYVADRLRLLRGDMEVLNALRRRAITFSVARELNKIGDEPMRRYYLDAAVRSTPPARVVAQWVAEWKAHAATVTTAPANKAEGEPAPAANPYHVACFLCGGDRDPYNLEPVYIHKWERENIEKMVRNGQQLNGESA